MKKILFLVSFAVFSVSVFSQLKVLNNGDVFIPGGRSYWINASNDVGYRLRLHHDGSNAFIDFYPNLYFRNGSNTNLSILSNGNVGIGNSSPTYKLDVSGTTRLNGYVGINNNNSDGSPLAVGSAYGKVIIIDPSLSSSMIGSSTGNINFYYPTTDKFMTVYASSYKTASDSTLKENIEPLSPRSLAKDIGIKASSIRL